MPRYADYTQSQLLSLARTYQDLTDAAQAELREEFAGRGLEAPLLEDVEKQEDYTRLRKLVTLRQYRDLSEAIVARSMLEANGIAAYLQDENLVRLDWQISNFIGGIRLQVEESDAATAETLLEEVVADSILLDGGAEFVQPRCPHCNSTEITFEGASRGAAIASLYLLSLPLPKGRETWLCEDCGTRWEDSGEAAAN
jgi:hypothetical protein